MKSDQVYRTEEGICSSLERNTEKNIKKQTMLRVIRGCKKEL